MLCLNIYFLSIRTTTLNVFHFTAPTQVQLKEWKKNKPRPHIKQGRMLLDFIVCKSACFSKARVTAVHKKNMTFFQGTNGQLSYEEAKLLMLGSDVLEQRHLMQPFRTFSNTKKKSISAVLHHIRPVGCRPLQGVSGTRWEELNPLQFARSLFLLFATRWSQ